MVINKSEKLLTLLQEFEGLSNEYTSIISLPALENNLKLIRNQCEHPEISIQVIYNILPDETIGRELTGWLLPETESSLHQNIFNSNSKVFNIKSDSQFNLIKIEGIDEVDTSSIGTVAPVITMVILNDSEPDKPDKDIWLSKLSMILSDRAYVIFIVPDSQTSQTNLPSDLLKSPIRYEIVNANTLSQSASLYERMFDKNFVDVMRTSFLNNALQSIDTLFSVFNLSLEQEERNLKAKKVMIQQQVLKVQSKSNSSQYDLLSQIKNLINMHLSQIEKGITDGLEDAIRPQTGSYSRMVDERIAKLEKLETTKGSKKTFIKIEEETEAEFLNSINNFFRTTGYNHLVTIRDSFKTLETEFNRLCEKHKINLGSFNIKHLTDEQLNIILESAIRYERTYSGNAPKKGFYEYFMALRKYQMILFMLASSFGLSFMKDLRMYMIPLTILLFGIGGYNLYKSVENETEENEQKELSQAKDLLKNEARRIGSEISKNWSKAISDYIKQQNTQLIIQAENQLKEIYYLKTAEEDEEKKKTQRQVQSLDNFDRKLVNILRNKDMVYKSFVRAKSEVRQLIGQQMK